VSLFGWRTEARSARTARRPGRWSGSSAIGPVLAGGLLVGLLSGCAVPAPGPAGTDPAGGSLGTPGPASAPADTAAEPTAPPTPSAAPAPAPDTLPEVPRRSADLAGQPAPASAPVRVHIPSLGIDMPIEGVGLDGDAMALPANPAVAAWYRHGPAPQSPAGATVIAAHVDSLVYDLGPFARLAEAPAGTEIEVYTADGAVTRYGISAIDTVLKQDVPWAGVFDRSGPPRLTLVTCGGEFDYDAKRYLSNVIVSAVPVP
jgi:sortase (surface protein transpeptidase)